MDHEHRTGAVTSQEKDRIGGDGALDAVAVTCGVRKIQSGSASSSARSASCPGGQSQRRKDRLAHRMCPSYGTQLRASIGGAAKKTKSGKARMKPWAGLTPEQRLERVNAIRRGRGLPEKNAL